MLASTNTILHERQLEEYYCTLCYAVFDLKRRTVTDGELGAALPDPLPRPARRRRSSCRASRSGRLPGRTYDELSFELAPGDVFVFCSDGVFEANDARGREFGADAAARSRPRRPAHTAAREIVDAIFAAVQDFRGDTAPNDDMTAVADQSTITSRRRSAISAR